MKANTQGGLTLIELMVVVAIIAILATVGYPAYTNYLQKARRADAQALLLEMGQFMERYYAQNGSYTGAALPDLSNRKTSSYYTVSLAAAAANTFSLQAAPTGSDSCGTLTLNQAGARGHSTGGAKCNW
ncbi:MAG TPA: type IV pilin protein [Chromatiales bacterium]|nr:type IV pilin protein [Chromatiales bacterium]